MTAPHPAETDVMSDLVATAHDNTLQTILPRMGRLLSTASLFAELRSEAT